MSLVLSVRAPRAAWLLAGIAMGMGNDARCAVGASSALQVDKQSPRGRKRVWRCSGGLCVAPLVAHGVGPTSGHAQVEDTGATRCLSANRREGGGPCRTHRSVKSMKVESILLQLAACPPGSGGICPLSSNDEGQERSEAGES